MNLNEILICILAIILINCSTGEFYSAATIKGPDGNPVIAINCWGKFANQNTCFQKAGEVCIYGYNIINSTSNSYNNKSYDGTMIISCKKHKYIEGDNLIPKAK